MENWITPKEARDLLGLSHSSKSDLSRRRRSPLIAHRWCNEIGGYRYLESTLISYRKMILIRRILAAKKKVAAAERRRARKTEGRDHPSSKLRAQDVVEIRNSPMKVADLAKRYGVSKTTIRDILIGRKWKDAGGPIRKRSDFHMRWEPTPAELDSVCAALRERGVWQDVSRSGVTPSTVKKYAESGGPHSGVINQALADGSASVAIRDAEMIKAVIAARRVCKSWGDAAARCGISETAITSLRSRHPSARKDFDSAATEGRIFWERSILTKALEDGKEIRTWARLARMVGVCCGTLVRLRKNHPDLDAQLLASRNEVAKDPTGFVYVVQDGHGMVKVGRTANVANRIRGMMTGNSSGQIEVLFSAEVSDSLDVEGRIHARLDSHLIHGEWFNVDPAYAVRVAEEEVSKVFDPEQVRLL